MGRSATALEFLPLADMKMELRLPASETSLDGLITRQIEAAVRFIEEETAIPLVSREETLTLPGFPLRLRPMILRTTHLLSVDDIKYFPDGGGPRAEPSGEINGADLGRVSQRGLNLWEVYWPDSGWPQSEYPVRVEVTRGLAQVDAGLRAATVAAVRDLFEGQRLVPGDDSMVNFLLQPYAPYGFG